MARFFSKQIVQHKTWQRVFVDFSYSNKKEKV